MGNQISSQINQRKWKRVNSVYDSLGKRLQVQKQIDKLNIQFDELTDQINIEKINLQKSNKDNENNKDNIKDDSLLHNSLLYSSIIN